MRCHPRCKRSYRQARSPSSAWSCTRRKPECCGSGAMPGRTAGAMAVRGRKHSIFLGSHTLRDKLAVGGSNVVPTATPNFAEEARDEVVGAAYRDATSQARATCAAYRWLCSVIRGHNNYYGVPTNSRALVTFRRHVRNAWHRQLQRRSQRARWTVEKRTRFRRLLSASAAAYRTSLAWAAIRWPVDRRWEPSAGNLLAGFCPGGGSKGPSLPGLELAFRLDGPDALTFPTLLRGARIDDEYAAEARAGLTWSVRLGEQGQRPSALARRPTLRPNG